MRSQGSGQEGLRAWTAVPPSFPARAWPRRRPHHPPCSLKLVWRCAGIPHHPVWSCLPQACPLPMNLHTGLPLAFGDQAGLPLQPASSVHPGFCLLSTATTTTSRVPVKSLIICAVRDKGQMGGTQGEREPIFGMGKGHDEGGLPGRGGI